jgi:hypothetical protein
MTELDAIPNFSCRRPAHQFAFWCLAFIAGCQADAAALPAAATHVPPAAASFLVAANESQVLDLFPSDLVDMVLEAKDARVVFFAPADEFAPTHSVASAKMTDAGALSQERLSRLRQQMFSSESYQPEGLNVARRFRPSYGFRFSGDAGEAWWLIAEYPRLAVVMLVAKDTDWRRSPSLVLRPTAGPAFKFLSKQGRR